LIGYENKKTYDAIAFIGINPVYCGRIADDIEFKVFHSCGCPASFFFYYRLFIQPFCKFFGKKTALLQGPNRGHINGYPASYPDIGIGEFVPLYH
jgi:hypothetical protein